MAFELWEVETANMIEECETEQDALAFVRNAVRAHGRNYVSTWELVHAWEDRDSEPMAVGERLIERAFKGIAA